MPWSGWAGHIVLCPALLEIHEALREEVNATLSPSAGLSFVGSCGNVSFVRTRRDCLRNAFFAAILTTISSTFSHGEDWICTDGAVYRDVTVTQVEDDAVTIRFARGAALIPLVKLPPTLQAKFNYDPIKGEAGRNLRSKRENEDPGYSLRQVRMALNSGSVSGNP
jgi:hypothetical protein